MHKIIIVLLAAIGLLAVVAVFALIATLPTMWLWNWLMPELFDLKVVTFWQALGINLLTGILFKNGGASSFSSSNNRR